MTKNIFLSFIFIISPFLHLSAESDHSFSSNKVIFYLIRHGQTDWNVEKRIQGQLPVVLNEIGRQQAAAKGALLQEIPFDACYSSDLPRAYETAQIITQNRDLEVRAESRIRERHRGKWQGHLEIEYSAAPQEDKMDTETDPMMCERIFHFLNEIVKKHQNETVLIVTHEQVIGNIVKELLHLDCHAVEIAVQHTGALLLEYCDGQLKIKELNGIVLP